MLVYDPKHAYDAPPGAGSIYLAHVDAGAPLAEYAAPLTKPLQEQVTSLTAQVAALQAEVHDLEQQIQGMQQNQQPAPKAAEALAAVLELAKALRVVGSVA